MDSRGHAEVVLSLFRLPIVPYFFLVPFVESVVCLKALPELSEVGAAKVEDLPFVCSWKWFAGAERANSAYWSVYGGGRGAAFW